MACGVHVEKIAWLLGCFLLLKWIICTGSAGHWMDGKPTDMGLVMEYISCCWYERIFHFGMFE